MVTLLLGMYDHVAIIVHVEVFCFGGGLDAHKVLLDWQWSHPVWDDTEKVKSEWTAVIIL